MIEITPRRLRSFMAFIDKPAGVNACWEWTGGKSRDGYATFRGGPAYRVAYEWLVAPIPDGMEVDHLCRNKACVNPHHLEPVTRSENLRRRCRSGPFQLRPYCRRGHALTGDNGRSMKRGDALPATIYCYACRAFDARSRRTA